MNPEDKQRNYELAEALLSEENFPAAVTAGAVATVLAAAVYSVVTVLWEFSYGFAAAGIGIVVGLSMQYLGRGIANKFVVVASVYTIAGCILGNVFRAAVELALQSRISPLEVIRQNELSLLIDSAVKNISLVDLVYWFVAVFFAIFLTKRPLSRAERLAIGMHKLGK